MDNSDNRKALNRLQKEGFFDGQINIKVFQRNEPELYDWLRTASKEDKRSVNQFAVMALKKALSDALKGEK